MEGGTEHGPLSSRMFLHRVDGRQALEQVAAGIMAGCFSFPIAVPLKCIFVDTQNFRGGVRLLSDFQCFLGFPFCVD